MTSQVERAAGSRSNTQAMSSRMRVNMGVIIGNLSELVNYSTAFRIKSRARQHRSLKSRTDHMHPMLGIAVRAARRAGAIISRASRDVDLLSVARKRHNDFVTEVDRAAEAAVIEVLHRAYPEHAILAEESGARPGKAGES